MGHEPPNEDDGLDLATKIHPKFRPVWEGRPKHEQAALALYFLPHTSRKKVLDPTRPRVIKWYCPFARQTVFPSGHRYCINVYTGCDHRCLYCYASGYTPEGARAKDNVERLLLKDLEDLGRFGVPSAPVHLSNSTDPFQPLEAEHGHTRFALEQILAHRTHFTSVVILTKNPSMAAQPGYMDLLKELGNLGPDHPGLARLNGQPAFILEASLAFWRDEARQVYDPGAPTVQERMEGILALREADIPVAIRIDPLFPCSPIGKSPTRSYADFELEEPLTADDLERLVEFATDCGAHHVVYSVAKITKPRGRGLTGQMLKMRQVYEAVAAPGKLVYRTNSWRLPPEHQAEAMEPLLELCKRHGLAAKHCRNNLIETP